MQASAEEQVQGEEAAPRSAEVISEDIVTDLKSVADAIFMLSSPSLQVCSVQATARVAEWAAWSEGAFATLPLSTGCVRAGR